LQGTSRNYIQKIIVSKNYEGNENCAQMSRGGTRREGRIRNVVDLKICRRYTHHIPRAHEGVCFMFKSEIGAAPEVCRKNLLSTTKMQRRLTRAVNFGCRI